MGDDTWLDLFNESTDFIRSYPYPSLMSRTWTLWTTVLSKLVAGDKGITWELGRHYCAFLVSIVRS